MEDLWETEPEAVEADTPAGTPNVKFLPSRTKRADALELLAESFLQNGAATMSGGDKHQIVVHVDAETLQTGCALLEQHADGAERRSSAARLQLGIRRSGIDRDCFRPQKHTSM